MNLTFWVRTKLVAGIVKGEHPNDCWKWLNSKQRQGYGTITHSDSEGRHTYYAHRVSFAVANGYIPTKDILHSCDNPECCNPLHLREGTHTDNMRDKSNKGRCNAPIGTNHAMSKLTEEEVIAIYKLKHKVCQQRLADSYKIDRAMIYNIWNKRNWTHITDLIDTEAAVAWELLKQSLPKIERNETQEKLV